MHDHCLPPLLLLLLQDGTGQDATVGGYKVREEDVALLRFQYPDAPMEELQAALEAFQVGLSWMLGMRIPVRLPHPWAAWQSSCMDANTCLRPLKLCRGMRAQGDHTGLPDSCSYLRPLWLHEPLQGDTMAVSAMLAEQQEEAVRTRLRQMEEDAEFARMLQQQVGKSFMAHRRPMCASPALPLHMLCCPS